MESTLVSARVPRAKKERAAGVLSALGATTSDLINSAFDYIIATEELPGIPIEQGRDAASFASFVRESTVDVEWPDGFEGDYKSLMTEWRSRDYESLA